MAAKAKKQLAENTEEEEVIIEDDYIPEQDETDDDKNKLEQIINVLKLTTAIFSYLFIFYTSLRIKYFRFILLFPIILI